MSRRNSPPQKNGFTYVPTFVLVSNLSSVTLEERAYVSVVGNIVSVALVVTVDPVAAQTAFVFRTTLPVPPASVAWRKRILRRTRR